ncbi:MAG: HEAT repeat domain-containing protein [Deltaproteobacteria bacterium]|nr:HEAT repeat domain-containing protein [Deltaproteobacteria bacterium]
MTSAKRAQAVAVVVLAVAFVAPPEGAEAQWSLTMMRDRGMSRGMTPGMRSRGIRRGMGATMATAETDAGDQGGPDRTAVLITRYRRILRADPRETFAFQRLLDLYRERDGDVNGLVTELQQEVESDPEAYPPRMLLGHLYKAQGQTREALALYARAAELRPNEAAPQLGLGALREATGDAAGAREAYEAALDRTSEDQQKQELVRRLAGLALDADDYEAARALYDRLAGRGATLFVRTELARALSERGEHVRAITEYERVLRGLRGDNRVIGPVLRDLARAQLEAGQTTEAIETLDRALTKVGRTSGIRREIYDVMVDAYRRGERLPELAEQLAGRGRDFDAIELLGRIHDELGNEEEALEAYRQALRLNRRDIDTRVRIVQLLSRSGRLDEVVEEYRALVRAAPREPRFVVELAQLLMQTGKREEAMRLAEQTSRRNNRDAGVHQALAELYTRWGESELASREIAALVRIDPRDPGHLIALGEQQLDEGRRQAALATWNRILQADNDRARAHATLAGVLADHDFLDEAESHYRKAVEADADGLEYIRGLATVLERPHRNESAVDRRRRDEEAATWWQKVLEVTEDRASRREARRRIVGIWSRRRELDGKRQQWRREFRAEPPNIDSGRFLAEAYLRAHPSDPARAEEVLQRIVTLEPGDVESLLALERVQTTRGDLEAAIATLRKLTSADPRRAPRYLQRMAEHAHALYRDEDAVRFAAEAVSRTPDDAEGHRRLGDLLRARQDLDGAIRAYEKALQLDERLFTTYFDLAELHLARGAHEEADRLYRRVLGLTPDDDLVSRAGRASLQIHLGAGSLEVLETDLLPLALSHPRRPIFRKLLVELYDSLTASWIQAAGRGDQSARENLDRLGHRALKPLLEALADPDPAQRRVAVDVLGHLGNPNAAGPLLAMAEGDAPVELRIRALDGVGRLGDPSLAARLAEIATGSERRLRPVAAWALAQVGGPRAVESLRSLLTRGDPAVRAHAALGLGRAQDTRSLEALTRALRSERSPAVQAAAAWALGRVGSADEVPALISGLRGGVFLVARASALALGELAERGADTGREALVEAIFDPHPQLRESAAAALAHARGERSEASPVGISIDGYLGRLLDVRGGSREVDLGPLAGAIEQAARSALHGPLERVRAALTVLAPPTTDVPLGLGPLTSDLRSWEAEPKAAAEETLRGLFTVLAPDLLGLATHPSPAIRAEVLARVAGGGDAGADPAAVAAALATAMDDPEATVRRAALEAVHRRHQGDGRLAEAIAATTDAPDWASRLRAVRALGRLAAPAGETALTRRLQEDSYAFVREAAAQALGELPGLAAGSRAALEAAAADDPEARVRRAARAALGDGDR